MQRRCSGDAAEMQRRYSRDTAERLAFESLRSLLTTRSMPICLSARAATRVVPKARLPMVTKPAICTRRPSGGHRGGIEEAIGRPSGGHQEVIEAITR